MFRLVAFVIMLLPVVALALPAEDHWGPDADTPLGRDLALAKGLIATEDYAAALPVLERLATEDAGNPDVFNLLGFAYRNTGNLEDSAPAYERALFLNPNHLGALEYQGELFLTLGEPARAEANLQRIEKACAQTCEEAEELAAAIAEWRATQGGLAK